MHQTVLIGATMETTKGQNDGEKSVHIGGSSETAENPRCDSRADHAGIPGCIDRESLEKARKAGFNVEAFLAWLGPWQAKLDAQNFDPNTQALIGYVAIGAFCAGEVAGLRCANQWIEANNG